MLSDGPPRAARRPDPARHGRARAARGAARRPRGRGGDGQRPRVRLRRAPRADRAQRGRFESEQALRDAIERILAPVGRRVDELSPMADARLADGSRVNVVIPPLAVDGPALSVRRFSAARPGPDGAGRQRDADPASSRDLLAEAVGARRSVLVSGGTGSGKTTLLNALSAWIDASRAGGDDRGRGRASPAPAARRPAREPAGVGRGPRRGDDPRPAPQRAADAPRPDRDRRGPRRRGARPADRAQHRPRGRALDRARELARGRAAPGRDAGADGRGRASARGDPRAARARLDLVVHMAATAAARAG